MSLANITMQQTVENTTFLGPKKKTDQALLVPLYDTFFFLVL